MKSTLPFFNVVLYRRLVNLDFRETFPLFRLRYYLLHLCRIGTKSKIIELLKMTRVVFHPFGKVNFCCGRLMKKYMKRKRNKKKTFLLISVYWVMQERAILRKCTTLSFKPFFYFLQNVPFVFLFLGFFLTIMKDCFCQSYIIAYLYVVSLNTSFN